ncbi:hypothetical protein T12_7937 [Trichinella patagoniensis]|uniref:Uncharacterized protein n=1 Tax=Trichinella patagoniensis TaxID=990121 RepID=A0A0V1ACV2_9BILA|nr:hypothetical protein T12_7937 [Trichinella patagoniensis]
MIFANFCMRSRHLFQLADSCAVVAAGKLKQNYATSCQGIINEEEFHAITIYIHILTGNINNACQHSSIKIAPTAHMLTAAGQETKKSTMYHLINFKILRGLSIYFKPSVRADYHKYVNHWKRHFYIFTFTD